MDQGKAFIVGRLSRDIEFGGEGDHQRAVFTVAYNRGIGEKRKSNFIDCIAWGKRADIMRDFQKGYGIFITGDLEQDFFETKEGQKRNRWQVNVSSITATTNLRRHESAGESTVGDIEVRVGGDAEESANIPF